MVPGHFQFLSLILEYSRRLPFQWRKTLLDNQAGYSIMIRRALILVFLEGGVLYN